MQCTLWNRQAGLFVAKRKCPDLPIFSVQIWNIWTNIWNRIKICVFCSVVDPDAGSGAFLIPGSGIRYGKKSRSGSGINIPDHISERLEIIFWVSCGSRSGIRKLWPFLYPVSGMEKFGSGMIFKTYTVLNTLHNYISYGTVTTVCAKKDYFQKPKSIQLRLILYEIPLKKYEIEAPWMVQTWSAAGLRVKGTRISLWGSREAGLKWCSSRQCWNSVCCPHSCQWGLLPRRWNCRRHPCSSRPGGSLYCARYSELKN